MKLVGGDSGHVEHEELVEEVILAPSERVVVDVQMAARITRQIVTARLGRARRALSGRQASWHAAFRCPAAGGNSAPVGREVSSFAA
jgi:hypothetical protein